MAPPITSFIGRDAAGFCLYSPIQENQRFLGITHAHLGTRVIDNTIFLPSLPDMASKASRFSEVGDTPFLLIHRLNSAFADGRHALWRRSLAGLSVAAASYDGSILTVTETNGQQLTFRISGFLAGDLPVASSDGNGGTNINWSTPAVSWTGPSGGDWSNPLNWSSGSVPTSSDNVVINNGRLNITGPAAAKSLTLNATTIALSGALTLGSGFAGNLNLQGGTLSAPGGVQGGSVTGYGVINADISDNVNVEAAGGTLVVNGILGAGLALIDNGATLEVGATSNAQIYFYPTGSLKLDAPASFSGSIYRAGTGTTIDLAGLSVAAASYDGSILTVTETNGQQLTFRISGFLAGDLPVASSDGNGGTDIGWVVAQPAAPSLSSVTPASYTADANNHAMQVFGSNFQNGDTLTFTDPQGNVYASSAAKLTFINSGEIDYQFNDDNDPGAWKVQVNSPDGTLHSGSVSFTVTGGGNLSPGFDTEVFPGERAMATLLTDTNLRWCGYYLKAPSQNTDTGWLGERAYLQGLGWQLAPLYVGAQDPAFGGDNTFVSQTDPTSQGIADAQQALAEIGPDTGTSQIVLDYDAKTGHYDIPKTVAVGQGFAAGTIVYLNWESTTITQADNDYIASWVKTVGESGVYLPGIYCKQGVMATLADLVAGHNVQFWDSTWDGSNKQTVAVTHTQEQFLTSVPPRGSPAAASWQYGSAYVAANGLLNGVDLDVSALYSAAPIPQAAVTTPPMPTSAPTISALPTAPLATAAQPVFNTLLQQSSPNLASYLSANTSITAPELATLSTDYKTKLQATNDYLGKADSIVGAESTGLGGVKGLYDTISKDIKTLDDLNPTDALLSAASAMLQMPYVKGLMSEDLNQGLQYGVTGAGVFTACLELAAATTPAGIAVAGALAILAASDFALQSLNLATEAATLADPPDQNYQQVFLPAPIPTLAAATGLPSDLATAGQAAIRDIDQATQWMEAVDITENRYATALAAGDANSASMQYAAFLNYMGLFMSAAKAAERDLPNLANELQKYSVGTQSITVQQYAEALNSAKAQASTPEMSALLKSLGFTDAQIQTMAQQLASQTAPTTASSQTPDEALINLASAFSRVTPGPKLHIASTGGPTNNGAQTISGTIDAADAGLTVSIYDGATLLGTANPAADGTWAASVTLSGEGTHYLLAKATDAARYLGTSNAATFTLDTTPPDVAITSAGGLTNHAAQAIAGTVDTADAGTIVTVYDAATAVGTATVGVDGRWSANVTLLGDGPHTISAIDTDAAGNTGTSAAVIYRLDTTAPTVLGFTASANSNDLNAGKTVSISLGTSAAVNVAGNPALTLNDGGTATYNAAKSTGTSLVFDYTVVAGQNTPDLTVTRVDLPAGASITDLAGNALAATLPSSAALGLQIDTKAPSIASIVASPSSGVVQVGSKVNIAVGLSEAVTLSGGTPTLSLNDGATATYSGISADGKTLTFTYKVATTDSSVPALAVKALNLNGASLVDAAGNAADLSGATSTFAGLQVDTLTPVITQVVSSPSSGDIGLLRTVGITLDFSKPVTVSGIPVLKLNDGGVAVYTGGSGTSALTFTYLPLPGQNTTDLQAAAVCLPLGSSIKDSAGHAANLAGASADLGLQVDTVIPVVSSVGASPATGPLNTGKTVAIALKMSEPVVVKGAPTLSLNDRGTAIFDAGHSTPTSLVFNYTVAAGQNTSALTITNVNMPSGASVQDLAGNPALLLGAYSNLGLKIDTAAPIVSKAFASPASGAVTTGSTVAITLQINETVTISGSPIMLLNDGGIATYDSAHSTATSLVFDYAVPSNQGTKSLSVIGLELPSPNSIEDLASNNADLSKAGANIGLKVNSITTAPAPITVSNTQEAEIFGASSENVSFVAGAGGTLKLDQAQSFTGNIQGFAAGDTLDLANLAFGPNTTLGFRPTASGGVLTVTNATQAAHIAVLGVYTASSFALASDGHGGTALSIPSTTAPTQLIANPLHA